MSHKLIVFCYLLCLCFLTYTDVKAQLLVTTTFPEPEDTLEVFRLNQLGKHHALIKNGWLTALSYYGDAYRLAQKVNYLKGEADALRNIAQVEARLGNQKQEALDFFLEELRLREKIGNKLEIANTYYYLGDLFKNQLHNTKEALGYYRQACILRDKFSSNFSLKQKSWKKIAALYETDEDFTNALQCYQKLLKLYVDEKQLKKASDVSMQISQLYITQNNFNKALRYATLSKKYYVKKITKGKKVPPRFDELIASLKQQEHRIQQENTRHFFANWLWIGFIAVSIVGLFLAIHLKKHAIK